MKKHLSSSQIRSLLDGFGKTPPCPARVVAQQEGEWPQDEPSQAMLAGGYLDALVTSCDGDKYLEQHPQMCKKNGDLYAAYSNVPDMAEALTTHGPTQKLITGCRPQVQQSSMINCTQFTGIFDWVDEHWQRVVELKKTASFADDWMEWDGRNVKVPFWMKWAEQMCIYRELVAYNKHEMPECYVVAIGDMPGYPIRHIIYDDFLLDRVYHRLIQRIELAKRAKQQPTYCRQCAYCAEHAPYELEVASVPECLLDDQLGE